MDVDISGMNCCHVQTMQHIANSCKFKMNIIQAINCSFTKKKATNGTVPHSVKLYSTSLNILKQETDKSNKNCAKNKKNSASFYLGEMVAIGCGTGLLAGLVPSTGWVDDKLHKCGKIVHEKDVYQIHTKIPQEISPKNPTRTNRILRKNHLDQLPAGPIDFQPLRGEVWTGGDASEPSFGDQAIFGKLGRS